jgi:hypothetical protein
MTALTAAAFNDAPQTGGHVTDAPVAALRVAAEAAGLVEDKRNTCQVGTVQLCIDVTLSTSTCDRVSLVINSAVGARLEPD